MSDPVRLLSRASDRGADSIGSLEREMLASARDDHAPLDAEERALAALGIGALALVAASAASAPGLSGTAALGTATTTATTTASSFAPVGASVGASVANGALKITGLAFAKWIGVGVVAIAAAAGTYEVVANNAPAQPRTSTMVGVAGPLQREGHATALPGTQAVPAPPGVLDKAQEEPGAPATPQALELGQEQATEPGKDEPRAITAPSGPSGLAGSGADTPRGGELAGELALLDQARGSLARRDATAATAALDMYARRYPNGTMREEATVARIEALLLNGQSAAAATQAEQFLREHPASTNTKRVRQLKKRAMAE